MKTILDTFRRLSASNFGSAAMDAESKASDGGKWITIHPHGAGDGKGRRIHINENGVIDKGNKHLVIALTQGGNGSGVWETENDANLSDAEYEEAVRSGDTKAVERMVHEAAARAMPNTKVVDDDGDLLRAYHATDNDFTVFDKRRLGESTDKNAADEAAKKLARLGFWFNEKDLHKKILAKKAVGAYLNITNPYETTLDDLWRVSRGQKAESFISELKSQGHDGIILEDSEFGGKSFVAFEAEQIKSAAPETYDDAGKLIPLSKRFDMGNPDIRY